MKFWRKLNKGCLFLIAIPFIILFGLWLFGEWVWGGSVKTSLDPQYIPTAEYLLQHPQPTPSLINVYPEPSTILTYSDNVDVSTFLKDDSYSIIQWSQFFVNNQRVSMEDIDVGLIYDVPDKKGMNAQHYVFTLTNRLTPGLHLFRIQIGSSFNDFLNPDPKLIYEWAYRVE